jgi:hypothetical protein
MTLKLPVRPVGAPRSAASIAPAGQAAPEPAESLLGTFGRIVGTGLEIVAKAMTALREQNEQLRTERDRARGEARLLAHAARAGMQAPSELLERVLAYPALPEVPRG